MDGVTIRSNGMAEMAYTGDKPWHGHGQYLEPGASEERWLQASGMDFRFQRAKVRYAIEHGAGPESFRTMDDRVVIFREDNKAPMAIVSDGYKVTQPKQVLGWMMDKARKHGFQLETAGTLFGGRRFWALASIGESALIVPKDKVGGYVLLCSSCDGSLMNTGMFTSVRVVCNNTLGMALGGQGKHKQSHRSIFDGDAMDKALGLAHDTFGAFTLKARALAEKQVSKERAERLMVALLAPKMLEKEPTYTELEKLTSSSGFCKIMALFNGGGKGALMDGVRGTAWGWVNSVTEYVDHHQRATSTENRLNSAWFGPGEQLKARALELATAL